MMNCTTPATFAVETVEHSCFPRVLPAVGMFVTTSFHLLTWFIQVYNKYGLHVSASTTIMVLWLGISVSCQMQ